MPELNGLLETVLVVDDLARARAFYETVLGLEIHGDPTERGCMFALPGRQLLGLLAREAADRPNEGPWGTVPACVVADEVTPGSTHLAFAISHSELEGWRTHLAGHDVEVLEEVQWDRGGRSLYFRDPDGRLLELATPGVWDFD